MDGCGWCVLVLLVVVVSDVVCEAYLVSVNFGGSWSLLVVMDGWSSLWLVVVGVWLDGVVFGRRWWYVVNVRDQQH
jgi:hypothetical protein